MVEVVEQVGGDRHRELCGEPGPRQVPEVDQPDRHRTPSLVAPCDRVEVGDVLVHGPDAQLRRERVEHGSGACHRVLGKPASVRGRCERRQRLDHRSGVAEVPLQRTVQRRVVEILEGQGDPGGHRTVRSQHGRREVARPVQRRAIDVRHEPQVVVHAVARGSPRDQRPVEGGLRHRDLEPGSGGRHVQHRRVLGLELGARDAVARDLEHEPAIGRVDEIVAVLVAAKLGSQALAAEMVPQQPGRLVEIEVRPPVLVRQERVVRHRRQWLQTQDPADGRRPSGLKDRNRLRDPQS